MASSLARSEVAEVATQQKVAMARRRAHRRPVGTAYRRRLPAMRPGGRPRYSRGWYVRLRRHGKEYREYGGPDKETALEVLEQLPTLTMEGK